MILDTFSAGIGVYLFRIKAYISAARNVGGCVRPISELMSFGVLAKVHGTGTAGHFRTFTFRITHGRTFRDFRVWTLR